jgi:hypothetical protein
MIDQPLIKVAPKKMNLPLNEESEGKKNVPINTGQHKMFTIENELNDDIGKSLLGNNFDFYFAFMAVYIFNWMGYLLVITFWNKLAAQFGALSGLGLSISKWTFLIQYSTDWILKDYSWFCWLLIILGLIVCIFSCKRYLKIQRDQQGLKLLTANDSKIFPKYEIFCASMLAPAASCECQKI